MPRPTIVSPAPSVSTGTCRSEGVATVRGRCARAAAGAVAGGETAGVSSLSGTASAVASGCSSRSSSVAVLVPTGSSGADGRTGTALWRDAGLRPGRTRPSPAGRPASDAETDGSAGGLGFLDTAAGPAAGRAPGGVAAPAGGPVTPPAGSDAGAEADAEVEVVADADAGTEGQAAPAPAPDPAPGPHTAPVGDAPPGTRVPAPHPCPAPGPRPVACPPCAVCGPFGGGPLSAPYATGGADSSSAATAGASDQRAHRAVARLRSPGVTG